MKGHCDCKYISYEMKRDPMIIHACHCTWCQRETGSAFAWNAVIERNQVEILSGETEVILNPSLSGKGQKIHRCPKCKVAVWSHYPGGGETVAFVRVGTLEQPSAYPPDVHIFTSTKQPWLQLGDAKAFAEFYNPAEVWTESMRERWQATRA